MKIQTLGNDTVIVKLNNVSVLVSKDMPVAAIANGHTLKTDRPCSLDTLMSIDRFSQGQMDVQTVPQRFLDELLENADQGVTWI